MSLPILEVNTERVTGPDTLGFETSVMVGYLGVLISHSRPWSSMTSDVIGSVARQAAEALCRYDQPDFPPMRFLRRLGAHYQRWNEDMERRARIATQLAPLIEERLAL